MIFHYLNMKKKGLNYSRRCVKKEAQQELVMMVLIGGRPINQAAKLVKIPYSTAKAIVKRFK